MRRLATLRKNGLPGPERARGGQGRDGVELLGAEAAEQLRAAQEGRVVLPGHPGLCSTASWLPGINAQKARVDTAPVSSVSPIAGQVLSRVELRASGRVPSRGAEAMVLGGPGRRVRLARRRA